MKTHYWFRSLTPAGRVYYFGMVGLGFAVLGFSIFQVCNGGADYRWLILACLTAVSGRFTVPIYGVKSKITISESFIFTNMIMFGPAAGCATAALDGLLGCVRSGKHSRRLQFTLFNIASMSLSAYLAGKTFFALLLHVPVSLDPDLTVGDMAIPAGAMALVHYLANTGTVAGIISLESHRNAYRVWRERFLWTSITYFAGASVAVVLAVNLHSLAPAIVGLVLPILFLTYFAFRVYWEKKKEIEHRQQLDRLFLRTVEALALAIDARESGTLGQAKHVQAYARALGKAMGIEDEKELRGIEAAALLLDIGNLAVPESILNKPGDLTDMEFHKVMTHPAVGADILSTINFPYPVVDYVRHHHERWDGTGYPDGLKGTDISLGARILSIADGYAAITRDRPYHPARSRDEALQSIRSRAGSCYDPELVNRLIEISDILTAAASKLGAYQSLENEARLEPGEEDSEPGSSVQHPSDLVAYLNISSAQREIFILNELSLELGTTLNITEMTAIAARKTAKLVPFTTCVIFLHSKAMGKLIAIHASGANAEAFNGFSMDMGANISGWVAEQRESVLNADASLDLTAIQERLASPLATALIHPLLLGNECIGTISLYASKEKRFRKDDLRIIGSISQKVAPAIQNARRYKEAEQEAAADPLTSLPNARYLRQCLARELAQAKRYGHPLAILGMDLDGFKALNDTYGHRAGDRMLVEVARVLRGMLRGSDLLVRHGGDEFIAALFQTSREEASQLAERIQRKIDSVSLEVCPGVLSGIGISIGCASFPEDGTEMEDLLHFADTEMYRDKRARAQRSYVHLQNNVVGATSGRQTAGNGDGSTSSSKPEEQSEPVGSHK